MVTCWLSVCIYTLNSIICKATTISECDCSQSKLDWALYQETCAWWSKDAVSVQHPQAPGNHLLTKTKLGRSIVMVFSVGFSLSWFKFALLTLFQDGGAWDEPSGSYRSHITTHTSRCYAVSIFPHTSIIWFRKCTLPGGLFTFYDLSYMTKKKEHVPLRCWTLDFSPYFCHRNDLYIILVLLLILTPSLRHWLGVGERCGMGYPKYFHQTKPECGPKKTAMCDLF